jgi:hypothetical protein
VTLKISVGPRITKCFVTPRAGANVLREEVLERAPERTGKLKKNVVVVTQGVSLKGKSLRGSTSVDVTP